MLNIFFHVFKEAIPKDYCDLIIKQTNWDKSLVAAVNRYTEGEIDPKSRITDIVWEELLSPVGCIIQSYMVEANNIWNYDIRRIEKVQMSKYIDGGHYDWHMDSKAPINNEQRKLSIVILLNNNFEGGGLEMETNQGESVLKSTGDIVVFPSFLNHKVTPVTKGARYTAVSWAYGPTFR